MLAAWMVVGLVALAPAEREADVLLRADFDAADALQAWSSGGDGEAVLVPAGDGQALRVTRTRADGALRLAIPLPAERLAGQRITFGARVKAENVSEPPQPWNGIKVMLHLTTPTGEDWPQASLGRGSFDWVEAGRTLRLPRRLESAELILGLESVSGTAWFDDVVVHVGRPLESTAERRPGPMYRGHDLPRLRGAMTGTRISADDIREFGNDWRGNLIRWQLNWTGKGGGNLGGPHELADFDAWLAGDLDRLESLLPVLREAGVTIVIDLHTSPGGRDKERGNSNLMLEQERLQDRFVEVWEEIARRFGDEEVVWGYDLINEPVPPPNNPDAIEWYDLAVRAARAIRAIDPDTAIIVEPGPWGGPTGFDAFDPLPLDIANVVYSFHMYLPHSFTHQGVHGAPSGVSYPGEIGGRHWDKDALEEAMRPAIDFQNDYNVHLFVGEFSAARWAPDGSAERYLRDLIDIFEKYGWDWTYHAWREADVWSVEHGPDPADRQRAAEMTARERMLREYFSRNEKPAWAGE